MAGNITINAPNTEVTGSLVVLPENFLNASSQLREACAVLRDGGYDRLAVLAAQISIRSEWGEA